jgi:hypothetical protein
MGIAYANLDDATRGCMAEESALGGHYISPRLTPSGAAAWVPLLDSAIASHDDDWLAAEIQRRGMMSTQENYTTKTGKSAWRNINIPHSAQMLAEGEFNRFYLRGLCLRAQRAGIPHLVIYRGRASSRPRPESEAKIGTLIAVDTLLAALRRNDFVSIEETALGVPGGPNSGLTARLP